MARSKGYLGVYVEMQVKEVLKVTLRFLACAVGWRCHFLRGNSGRRPDLGRHEWK